MFFIVVIFVLFCIVLLFCVAFIVFSGVSCSPVCVPGLSGFLFFFFLGLGKSLAEFTTILGGINETPFQNT